MGGGREGRGGEGGDGGRGRQVAGRRASFESGDGRKQQMVQLKTIKLVEHVPTKSESEVDEFK